MYIYKNRKRTQALKKFSKVRSLPNILYKTTIESTSENVHQQPVAPQQGADKTPQNFLQVSS